MTNSNDSTDESSLTCLLVLAEMAASKLENNDNLMKLLTLAQLDASKLEDENDKLRKDVIDLDVCYQILSDRLGRDFGWAVQTDVENDKLRKLVKDIWNDACHFDDFYDYVHDDGTHYFESELPHYQERMRKLGIEVD